MFFEFPFVESKAFPFVTSHDPHRSYGIRPEMATLHAHEESPSPGACDVTRVRVMVPARRPMRKKTKICAVVNHYWSIMAKIGFGKPPFWTKNCFGKSDFGKNRFGENRSRKKLFLGETILTKKIAFGKTDIGKNVFGRIDCDKKSVLEKPIWGKNRFGTKISMASSWTG